MRLVYQLVSSASVVADGEPCGHIGRGCVLLLGVGQNDTERDADILAKKAAELRVFEDENGKMNYSLLDIGGGALVVSNFTLYGNCRHGRRPEFLGAARPAEANTLYEYFMSALRVLGVAEVQSGRFGADMQLDIHGDGPVTLILDSAELLAGKE